MKSKAYHGLGPYRIFFFWDSSISNELSFEVLEECDSEDNHEGIGGVIEIW
jgi:hypothetical protein